MSKYRNTKVEVDGVKFDSRAEARRFATLQALQKAGYIAGLRHQVVYTLAPGVKIEGESRARPPLRYVADFEYAERRKDGSIKVIVEDVKGVQTPAFRIKRHLMKTVFNIDVKVTK